MSTDRNRKRAVLEDLAIIIVPIVVCSLLSIPLLVRAALSDRRARKRQADYAQYKKQKPAKSGRKKKRFHEATTSSAPRDRALYYGTVAAVGLVLLGLGVVLVTQQNFYAAIWGWPAIVGGGGMILKALFRRSREVPTDWHVMLTLLGGLGSGFCVIVGTITTIGIGIAAFWNPALWGTVILVACATAFMGGFVLLFMRLEKVK